MNRSKVLRCALLFATIAAFSATVLAEYVRPSVCAEYVESAAVFTGKVLSERRVEMQGDRDPGWVYRVRVTKVLKGSLHGIVEVYTSDTTIRFPLKVGTEYVLFADDFKRGPIEIGEPTNSGPVSARGKTLAKAQQCSSSGRASHDKKVIGKEQCSGGLVSEISPSHPLTGLGASYLDNERYGLLPTTIRKKTYSQP